MAMTWESRLTSAVVLLICTSEFNREIEICHLKETQLGKTLWPRSCLELSQERGKEDIFADSPLLWQPPSPKMLFRGDGRLPGIARGKRSPTREGN